MRYNKEQNLIQVYKLSTSGRNPDEENRNEWWEKSKAAEAKDRYEEGIENGRRGSLLRLKTNLTVRHLRPALAKIT